MKFYMATCQPVLAKFFVFWLSPQYFHPSAWLATEAPFCTRRRAILLRRGTTTRSSRLTVRPLQPRCPPALRLPAGVSTS